MEYSTVVLNYRNKYPLLSFCKLAQQIVKEEKLDIGFNTLRKLIPDILNKSSKKDNVVLDDANFDIDIPGTLYEEREHFILPKSRDNILIISDIHIPFHKIEPLKIALAYGKERGINTILINGDLIDFYGLSKFTKKSKWKDVQYEINLTVLFLKQLLDKFDAKIYFKYGNHEERLETYLQTRAPELENVDNLQLHNLLKLPELGVEFIDNKRAVRADDLYIIHGHEIKTTGNVVNIARTIRLKAQENILVSNFHRTQEDITRTISDKVKGAWAVGCLSGLSPDYLPVNDWNWGFAIVERFGDGTFHVDNRKIINGKVK